MESIEAFCDRYDACGDGKKWALENCSTMDDVWERANPEWLIWVATRDGVLEDKTLRLFACFCARQIWPLLEDERSRNAVLVAEKFADGDATEDDLTAACAAARAAERDAEQASAWDATRVAACAAARAAARAAAWDAACAAARATACATTCATAWDAACAAARDAAWDAARDASWAASWDASWAAAWDAAWDAARDAARCAARVAARGAALINQAKWLRENAKANFKLAGSVT